MTMAFTIIETQEAFDAAVKERIEREREKYKDYDDLKKQVSTYEKTIADMQASEKSWKEKQADFEKQIADKDGQIKSYAEKALKLKVAREAGLPFEFADRLMGSDEEALKKDADSLKAFVSHKSSPAARTEPAGKGSNSDDAYATLARQLVE